MSRLNLRKRPRISYYEPEEPNLDEYVFCTECADFVYEYCAIHGPLLVVPDDKIGEGQCSTSPLLLGAGIGVFSTLTLPRGVRFGPYRGLRTNEINSMYCWQIYDGNKKPSHVIDAMDASRSNWMRYVNCARHWHEQNLVAYQYQGQIYYRTIKIVPRFTKLMVFYGSEFANLLDVDLKRYNSPASYAEKMGAVLKKPTSTVQKMKKFIAPPSATRDNNQTVLKRDTSCSAISKVDKLNIGADVSEKIKCNLPEQNKLNESTPKDMTTSVKDGDLNSVIKMSIQTSQANKDENGSNIEKSFEENISSDDITVQIDKMLETKMSCNQCSYKTGNKKHLICHLKAHIGKSFQCHLCSYRSLFKTNLESHHLIVHSGEKNYKCDICSKKFSQKSDLKRHLTVHSGEKNYKCDICSKKFSQKRHLKLHLTVHSGEKNYKCDICSKKFSQKIDLKRHLTVHSGEKNYKCDICSKKFSQKSNLNQHLTVHSGEKNYKCDICSKKFSQKSNLNQHLTVHSGEKNHKCDICSKRFTTKSYLKIHLLTVHSGENNYKL